MLSISINNLMLQINGNMIFMTMFQTKMTVKNNCRLLCMEIRPKPFFGAKMNIRSGLICAEAL